MADFGPSSAPTNKAQFARQVMGNDGDADDKKGKGKSSTFHSMHIEHASNGVMIDHRVKTKGKKGGSDSYDSHHSHKVLVTNDHPMHKHIQALHEHSQSEAKDCKECD